MWAAAALAATAELRDRGGAFVVAPVRADDGEPLVRANEDFAVALYPFVDGQSYQWGEFSSPEHRRGVLDLVVAVHAAPEAVRRLALADDFGVAHRDELEIALDEPGADCGPYAERASALVRENAGTIRRLLAGYDELVARVEPGRAVLTHGEPHPGNTMRADGRWLLIDWETVLVAPPERDLWGLAAADGSVLDAYAEATGVRPLPAMLELYRLRWDLSDVAVGLSRFRCHHTGDADDHESWVILHRLVNHLATTGWTAG